MQNQPHGHVALLRTVPVILLTVLVALPAWSGRRIHVQSIRGGGEPEPTPIPAPLEIWPEPQAGEIALIERIVVDRTMVCAGTDVVVRVDRVPGQGEVELRIDRQANSPALVRARFPGEQQIRISTLSEQVQLGQTVIVPFTVVDCPAQSHLVLVATRGNAPGELIARVYGGPTQPTTFHWDLGNGQTVETSVAELSYAYTARPDPSTRVVRVTATNAAGIQSEARTLFRATPLAVPGSAGGAAE